ncbi:hypothetical protein BTS2_0121 [Bacillus sp. TS-2]|nr:hypothetical protein BTS2_0121 [Bacillus sp. TS-2]
MGWIMLIVLIVIATVSFVFWNERNLHTSITINQEKSFFYEHIYIFYESDKWTHYLTYDKERLRIERHFQGRLEGYMDVERSAVRRVELQHDENHEKSLSQAFITVYLHKGIEQLMIKDPNLLNQDYKILKQFINELNDNIKNNKKYIHRIEACD